MFQYIQTEVRTGNPFIADLELNEIELVDGGVGAVVRVVAKAVGYLASTAAGGAVGTFFTKAVRELAEALDD